MKSILLIIMTFSQFLVSDEIKIDVNNTSTENMDTGLSAPRMRETDLKSSSSAGYEAGKMFKKCFESKNFSKCIENLKKDNK